jgi:hypothetical protein
MKISLLRVNYNLLLLLLLRAIELSLCGSTKKKARKPIHKTNNTKKQYQQYKTQKIQVHSRINKTNTVQNPHIPTPIYYKTN